MTHKPNSEWKLATQALHAGEEEKFADSHVTPIFASSTFVFPDADTGRKRFAGEDPGYIYTRLGNPTVKATERKLAVLEGAKLLNKGINVEGYAYSTGMGCINSVFLALTKAGDEIICCNPVYGGTNYFLDGVMSTYNVKTHFVETAGEVGLENIKKVFSAKTKLIFLESPSNPNLAVSDIAPISKFAKEKNIPVIVDNTFATPVLQRPLELGAAISLHSTTKYLNGHGTSCSGLLASQLTGELRNRLFFIKKNLGATQSAFDAFLVLNGMKTLPLRMKQHCINAQAIAEYLSEHPKVKSVSYPGLTSHPQHEIAKRQMGGMYGGMVSFELKGGIEAGKTLMNNVHVFTLAVSLGTVDSLIEHPASMTHASYPQAERLKGGITDGLVRASVGIEDLDDIIADLDQGLAKV